MESVYLAKDFDAYGSDGYCAERYQGIGETRPHWHSGYEIIYMEKGESVVFFEDKWFTIGETDALVIPVGSIHCWRCYDKNAVRIVAGFTQNCVGETDFSTERWDDTRFCHLKRIGETPVAQLLSQLTKLSKNTDAVGRLMAKSTAIQLYAHLLKRWIDEGFLTPKSRKNPIVKKVKEYISQHFKEDISPYQVCKQLFISYSYLAKLLREEEHTTFQQLLTCARVEEAKKLLSSSAYSVTEIGYLCGFCDSSYFIKTFRVATGITPKKYRESVFSIFE